MNNLLEGYCRLLRDILDTEMKENRRLKAEIERLTAEIDALLFELRK